MEVVIRSSRAPPTSAWPFGDEFYGGKNHNDISYLASNYEKRHVINDTRSSQGSSVDEKPAEWLKWPKNLLPACLPAPHLAEQQNGTQRLGAAKFQWNDPNATEYE